MNKTLNKLRKNHIIEWTTGLDLRFLCTIWKNGKLKANGIGDSIEESFERAADTLTTGKPYDTRTHIRELPKEAKAKGRTKKRPTRS